VQELDLSLLVRSRAALADVDLDSAVVVADLGCATGTFAARLARPGRVVTAVDSNAESLAELRRLHRDLVDSGLLHPLQADLAAVPLEPGSVDAAFCMEVLEHVRQDGEALTEFARLIRPGGTLVVSVPNLRAPKPLHERLGARSVHHEPGPAEHVREGYTEQQLRGLLEAAGFRVTHVVGVGGVVYRLAAGIVALIHLGYRRIRGQRSWSWADMERDAERPIFRAYARVFRVFAFAVGLERVRRPPGSSAMLLATAVRE
jgi:2-polyprenyl-3-methyl-5-hydroxy-6-metoxy-1,4-benzoquinol methylase